MTHISTNQSLAYHLTSRLQSLVASVRAARAHRTAFNTAYAELQMLSERELVEFGLHRSDLVDLARTEAWNSSNATQPRRGCARHIAA